MDESHINSTYDEEYYSKYGHNRIPYHDNQAVVYTLQKVGDSLLRYAKDVKTHLDVGCAMGHLVAHYRSKGIESYGVDASPYAIKNVVIEARRFVKLQNILDIPEDKKYDLVTCIEILEHLDPSEEDAALDKLCALSDKVFFSSAEDYNDPTHFNVHPVTHWVEKFLGRGFVSIATPSSLIPWGRLFVRAKSYMELSKLYDQMTRADVLMRDRFKCVVTGKKGVHVHEIVPRSAFGKSTMHLCFHEKNRVCLSVEEHQKAHTKEYRRMLIQLMKDKHGYEYPEKIFQKYIE